MSTSKVNFGTMPDGGAVSRFTIVNKHGASASMLSYGATWQAMLVPDRNGRMQDVLLGYDSLAGYLQGQMYLGATIGRVANRIAKSRFMLNGREFRLFPNDGENSSHGGRVGFDKKNWTAEIMDDAVAFTLHSPDGEEGYPGSLTLQVTYALNEDNALSIRYRARADQDTIVNFTNHAYFNLAGQGNGTVLDHLLRIDADQATRVDAAIMPTGEIVPVRGGALDFTRAKPIGRDIGAKEENMAAAGGYDHNFVLRPANGQTALFARAVCPRTGIALSAYTDQPGVQLYTPDTLGGAAGKQGAVYGAHPAFCLETQHFPNAMEHPEFPSIVLPAEKVFISETIYQFAVE